MYSHQSYINEVCAALYQAWKKLKLENFEHRDDSFDWWINSNKITLSNLHRSRHDGENCRRLNKGLSALKFGDDIMTLMREWSRIGWINFRQRGKSGSFIAKSALLFMTINLRLWGERQRVTVFLPPKRNKSGRFEGRMPSPYLISCRYNVWKNADHSGWSQLARHGREGTDITRIKPLLAQHDLLPSRGHSGWSDGRGRWRRQSNQSNSNLSSLLLPFEYRWGEREGDTHHTLRGPKASMAKGWTMKVLPPPPRGPFACSWKPMRPPAPTMTPSLHYSFVKFHSQDELHRLQPCTLRIARLRVRPHNISFVGYRTQIKASAIKTRSKVNCVHFMTCQVPNMSHEIYPYFLVVIL